MRHVVFGVLGTLALGLGACSSSSPTPTSPSATTEPSSPALGAVIQTDTQLQAALGLHRIEVDPATLSGSATLVATRSGAANDDLYLLPIDNFLRPNSLKVTGVSSTTTTLELAYTFAHPFAAPSNLAGPPTAANRADLGVAAVMVVLADQPTPAGNTYFTDQVVNSELVQNPDFYWDPGALIPATGLSATIFPVQMLVDEAGPDGNRIGVSNGGDPTGNFGNDGWTQAELTFSPDNWTGFGVLHQGQRVANMLSLSKAEIGTLGGFSFDVAILAKYNDPRGGMTGAEKRGNRLPPAIPDASLFAYRMPHGAWDLSRIAFVDSSDPFIVGSLSSSHLAFRVDDFDARAIETSVGDLSGDVDVTTVSVGEAGIPAVSVSLPGVIGDATVVADFTPGAIDDDSAFGGDVGADTGHPGDALFFREAILSGPTGPAAGGSYTGLVRVTDPEVANIADPAFILELDGTLTPLSAGFPAPIAYQSFEVVAEVPVTSNGFAKRFGGVGSEEGRGLAVDSLGNIYVGGRFTQSADFGGGVRTTTGSSDYDCVLIKLDANGDYVWDRTFGSPNTGIVERIDAIDVDSNDNVVITGYTRGPVDFGGGPVTTTGFSDVFIAKYTPANTLIWSKNFGPPTTGNSAEGYGVTVDPADDSVYATGQYYVSITPPGGSMLTSLGSSDVYLVKYSSTGTFSWAKSFGANNLSSLSDGGEMATVDAAGGVYVVGRMSNNVDFGGGVNPGASNFDGFLVKYTSTGTYQWDKRMGNTGADWAYDVQTSATSVYVTGFFNTSIDLGGGTRLSAGGTDGFVARYNLGGLWQWDDTLGGTNSEWCRELTLDPNTGALFVAMDYADGIDFGGGARTTNGGRDVAIISYNNAGGYVWDSRWGGSSTDFCWALDADPNGNPVAGGHYFGATVDFDPGPGSLVLPSAGSSDIFVVKLLSATGLF